MGDAASRDGVACWAWRVRRGVCGVACDSCLPTNVRPRLQPLVSLDHLGDATLGTVEGVGMLCGPRVDAAAECGVLLGEEVREAQVGLVRVGVGEGERLREAQVGSLPPLSC